MKTILFIVNDAEFFVSHRLNLALAAVGSGMRAIVAAPDGPGAAELPKHGIEHFQTPQVRASSGLRTALTALASYNRAMRVARPDLVHLITSKPVIIGGMLARLHGIPALCAISGLGYAFIGSALKTRIMRLLVILGYRAALNDKDNVVVFQNNDDQKLLNTAGSLSKARLVLIPGSGVDVEQIRPAVEPPFPIVSLLPARLLGDKGVREFVEAAQIVKLRNPDAIFRLQGKIDQSNPTAISQAELTEWVNAGVVEYRPHSNNPHSMYASAHIVVLPSYREGLSKTLIDAAAAGRAVVTTDVPGCRDAMVDNITGLLVPPRNPVKLAEAMTRLIEDDDLRRSFGQAGRSLAERKFDIAAVTQKHLELYASMAKQEIRA